MNISDISITSLKKIPVMGGDVWHAMKEKDDGFKGFGEAYFSLVNFKTVKAWKMHLRMTMNIIVPVGEVKFVFMDNLGEVREERIGVKNYVRLTIPPRIWFGFQGISVEHSMLLNIADIQHNPEEVDKKNIEEIEFNWSNK